MKTSKASNTAKKGEMGRWVWVKGSASTLGSTNSKLIWSAWLTWHTVPYIWPKLSKRREKSLENALCIKTEQTALLCIDCIAQIVCNNQTEIVRIRKEKKNCCCFFGKELFCFCFSHQCLKLLLPCNEVIITSSMNLCMDTNGL